MKMNNKNKILRHKVSALKELLLSKLKDSQDALELARTQQDIRLTEKIKNINDGYATKSDLMLQRKEIELELQPFRLHIDTADNKASKRSVTVAIVFGIVSSIISLIALIITVIILLTKIY